MTKEIDLADRYETMNRVVELYLRGTSDPTKIANQLNLKRAEVITYLDEWRDIAANDQSIQLRAREALGGMDKHYNMIIEEMWDTVHEAGTNGDLKTKASTLKSIADVEKQRLDALQKAGIFNDQEMADQIAEMERQRDVLVGIIKDVSGQCPHCKPEVARRIAKLNPNKSEPVDITDQVVISQP